MDIKYKSIYGVLFKNKTPYMKKTQSLPLLHPLENYFDMQHKGEILVWFMFYKRKGSRV